MIYKSKNVFLSLAKLILQYNFPIFVKQKLENKQEEACWSF